MEPWSAYSKTHILGWCDYMQDTSSLEDKRQNRSERVCQLIQWTVWRAHGWVLSAYAKVHTKCTVWHNGTHLLHITYHMYQFCNKHRHSANKSKNILQQSNVWVMLAVFL